MRKRSQNARTNRNTPVLIGVLLLLVAAFVATGIALEVSGRAAYADTQEAINVRTTERNAFSLMVDMETSERGYIITRDQSFLKPYTDAVAALTGVWSDLLDGANGLDSETPAGAPKVAPLVQELRRRAETWQQEAAEPEIVLTRQGRTPEAFNLVSTGKGKQLFDDVRQTHNDLTDRLNILIEGYARQVTTISTLHLGLIVGLGLLSLAGAVLALRVARREAQLQDEATIVSQREAQTLLTTIENLPVAVRLMGPPDGAIILQNDAAETLFPAETWNALAPEERIAHFGITRPDGSRLPYQDFPVSLALKQGIASHDVEARIDAPGIGPRNVLVSAVPLRDYDGQVTAAVVVAQDVTQMREQDHRKDEFIATAAHELRNPLAALAGYTQLLRRMIQRGNMPEQVLENRLNEIDQQVRRLDRLVEHLLDASRIELGRLILDRHPTDLCKLARQVVAEVKTADKDGHLFEVDAERDELVGDWDPGRIEQVLTNLLGNAARYSPPNSSIRLRLSRSNGEAQVQVIDEGPGVPPGQRAHLFDRYYQTAPLDSAILRGEMRTIPKRRGLGLGLFISKEIVSAHGGNIGVEPNPEGGSIFWFTLPIQRRQQ